MNFNYNDQKEEIGILKKFLKFANISFSDFLKTNKTLIIPALLYTLSSFTYAQDINGNNVSSQTLSNNIILIKSNSNSIKKYTQKYKFRTKSFF